MISSGLIPTRRAVIDINRPCNARCRMCYYTYDRSDWSRPLDEVKNELRGARERGNTSVDFTGGEPTIYPQMAEAI
ncbi:MAG: radical SAM protein, partial [Syntrophobacteraceae bacterium]